MIPEDPYGKNGPSLQFILHKLKADANVDEKYLDNPDSSTAVAEDEPSVIVCENESTPAPANQ